MRRGIFASVGGGSGSSITVQQNMIPSDANPPSVNAVLSAIGSSAAVNDIGIPGAMGFGVGICPAIPAGFSELIGTRDKLHDNYGNYIHNSSGSIMCWVPAHYHLWGTGANGFAINNPDIKPLSAFANQAAANAAGYALDRSFVNAGAIKTGVFVDKFFCSNNGAGVAASIKKGIPLSSSAANNGFSTLINAPANDFSGALVAAKTRGANFFCSTRYIRVMLARLALAQAQNAEGPHICAWIDEDGITSYPKGCNNNALGDSNDPMVIYLGTGYQNAGRTGSATHFARTTHNGQANGVADLNGCIWAIELGMTSNGSNFFALKTSVDVKNLTAGNTLATDAWGAAGIAANYDDLGATFRSLTASNSQKSFGSASAVFAGAVSGNNWQGDSLGLPVNVSGTNLFGSDGLWDYRVNELCPISGGHWYNGATAGVWALHLSNVRSSSIDSVGFRAALYL
jgi:hypothetical protein